MSVKGKTATAGLGVTAMGRIYGRDSTDFAAEAVKLALDDAGLKKDDLDGLLINAGAAGDGLTVTMQNNMGLKNLNLLNHMNVHGATSGAMIKFAALAVEAGMADVVACVYADAPLTPTRSGGQGLWQPGTSRPHGNGQPRSFLRPLRRQHPVRSGGPAAHG